MNDFYKYVKAGKLGEPLTSTVFILLICLIGTYVLLAFRLMAEGEFLGWAMLIGVVVTPFLLAYDKYAKDHKDGS